MITIWVWTKVVQRLFDNFTVGIGVLLIRCNVDTRDAARLDLALDDERSTIVFIRQLGDIEADECLAIAPV